MSNEKLARQWAERKKAQAKRHMEDAGYFPREDTMAAIEHVLATTDPLTMADVEWDTKKHHLAGATLPDGHEVVMMWPDTYGTGHIIAKEGEWPRERLTPNGKRYELREVGAPEQPAHPATLETVEDYVNAPEGTTVAEPGYTAWTKVYDGNWWRGDEDNTSHWMAGTKRDMLRKGWGQVTTNITPEHARELLDIANRGAGDGQRPVTVAASHAPLAEAAPALAELVANLHYEYAVQKLDGNEWKLTDLDGRALESYESEKVTWWPAPIPQSDIADRGPGWRIVRRLAGEPEVVE